MLKECFEQVSGLTEEDLGQLRRLYEQLALIAELSGCDVFIDCADERGGAMVAAHAKPSTLGSAYQRQVVGQSVLPDREPAVFRAMEMKMPVRDIKAITQEDKVVRQDVAPILNGDGRCIGVLIQEKDISGELRHEKKYQTLARTYEQQDQSLRANDAYMDHSFALREVHHRVKNNLQLVASILSLHSRRCADQAAKRVLEENVNRVLSIAAIHDILTKNEGGLSDVDSCALLEQLRKNLQSLVPEGIRIQVQAAEPGVMLPADVASAVALVVNELVTNALKHAFPDRDSGRVCISFRPGALFHTVTVSDDGVGFDPEHIGGRGSLGLRIVEATVRDRLHSQLNIHSDQEGTRISFDLRTE